MEILKALATVVGTAAGLGIFGTVIGVFLGRFAPEFFRQMLPLRDPINFNPVEVRTGLGLTNGFGWGRRSESSRCNPPANETLSSFMDETFQRANLTLLKRKTCARALPRERGTLVVHASRRKSHEFSMPMR